MAHQVPHTQAGKRPCCCPLFTLRRAFSALTPPRLLSTEDSAAGDTPDWLKQAVVKKMPKPRATGTTPRTPVKATGAPLSWMSTIKRRSSLDLEDTAVETPIADAKSSVVPIKSTPGGWLQMGALGAPDALKEEKALEEAQAASSLRR